MDHPRPEMTAVSARDQALPAAVVTPRRRTTFAITTNLAAVVAGRYRPGRVFVVVGLIGSAVMVVAFASSAADLVADAGLLVGSLMLTAAVLRAGGSTAMRRHRGVLIIFAPICALVFVWVAIGLAGELPQALHPPAHSWRRPARQCPTRLPSQRGTRAWCCLPGRGSGAARSAGHRGRPYAAGRRASRRLIAFLASDAASYMPAPRSSLTAGTFRHCEAVTARS